MNSVKLLAGDFYAQEHHVNYKKCLLNFFIGMPDFTTPAKMQLHQIPGSRQALAFSLSDHVSFLSAQVHIFMSSIPRLIVAGIHYKVFCPFYK